MGHELNTSEFPNPDLLIRTSGEMRISNFLLWEIAYSEIHFTDVLWPDFNKEDFFASLKIHWLVAIMVIFFLSKLKICFL